MLRPLGAATGGAQGVAQGVANSNIFTEKFPSQTTDLAPGPNCTQRSWVENVRPVQAGLYLGSRGADFVEAIRKVLSYGQLKPEWLDLLLDKKSLETYEEVFTSRTVDPIFNYETHELHGDRIIGLFMSEYFNNRFPQLACTEGVKVKARLIINYGSKTVLAKVARDNNFFSFISASNEERQLREKDLLEDVMEAFIGATAHLIDSRIITKEGHRLGYSSTYKILQALYDAIPIDISYEKLYDPVSRLKELFDLHGAQLGRMAWREVEILDTSGSTSVSEVRFGPEAKSNDFPQKLFDVTAVFCPINSREEIPIGNGRHKYKQEACNIAAEQAIAYWEQRNVVKKPPRIYALFAQGKNRDVCNGPADVFRICGTKDCINDLFPTQGRNKHSSRYEGTVLIHYCRHRDLVGIQTCIDLQADPSVKDVEGLNAVDRLLIGPYKPKFMSLALPLLLKSPVTIQSNIYDVYWARYSTLNWASSLASKIVRG
jgi:dsRNA-specific ribonuclease